jgi:hypothetical protein
MLLNNMERYTQKSQKIPDYNQLLFYNQSKSEKSYESKISLESTLPIVPKIKKGVTIS